jgi:hypothetical protein
MLVSTGPPDAIRKEKVYFVYDGQALLIAYKKTSCAISYGEEVLLLA